MYLNATLFAQIAVFIILALFTMKFVWPPIVKALDERAAKIAEGLAAAERGQHSLELAAKRSAEAVREGKQKMAEIVAQAGILAALRGYRFSEAEAGERDRGSFDYRGTTVYFRIEYYDAALEYGSEDPADASITRRVLTIMLREDL